jgi:hypothetical protein
MSVTGQLFYDPQARPVSAGTSLPLAYYNFYVSGTTTPQPVYQDAGLVSTFPVNSSGQYVVTADGTGLFPAIFMNPAVIYRVQLFNSSNVLLEDVDPFVPAFPVSGTGPITFNAQGEMTINPPIPGGAGYALTLSPVSGGQALKLIGVSAGNAALVINNAVTSGAQTATFSAVNKPGSGTTSPSKWLPIICDGSTYYLPLWL